MTSDQTPPQKPAPTRFEQIQEWAKDTVLDGKSILHRDVSEYARTAFILGAAKADANPLADSRQGAVLTAKEKEQIEKMKLDFSHPLFAGSNVFDDFNLLLSLIDRLSAGGEDTGIE